MRARARVPSRRGSNSVPPRREPAAAQRVGADGLPRPARQGAVHGRGPAIPAAAVRRRRRPGSRRDAAQRDPDESDRAGLLFLRHAGRGQDHDGPDLRQVPQLREREQPTEDPCQVCDICQAIAQGQDVDVIEIDGASNNGVEQVRELRQNAGLRPSRARFKIYYIDEVHMLSTGPSTPC